MSIIHTPRGIGKTATAYGVSRTKISAYFSVEFPNESGVEPPDNAPVKISNTIAFWILSLYGGIVETSSGDKYTRDADGLLMYMTTGANVIEGAFLIEGNQLYTQYRFLKIYYRTINQRIKNGSYTIKT